MLGCCWFPRVEWKQISEARLRKTADPAEMAAWADDVFSGEPTVTVELSLALPVSVGNMHMLASQRGYEIDRTIDRGEMLPALARFVKRAQ